MLGAGIALLGRRLPLRGRLAEVAGVEGGETGLIIGPRAAGRQQKSQHGQAAEPPEICKDPRHPSALFHLGPGPAAYGMTNLS